MPDIDSYNDLVKAGWSLSSPRSRPCQYAVRNHFEQKLADQHREGGQIIIARRRTCGGVFQLAKKYHFRKIYLIRTACKHTIMIAGG
jgi:hypothetical protein